MLVELSYTIANASMNSIVLPFMVGLLKFRQHSKIQRLLFLLISVGVIVEILLDLNKNPDDLQPILYSIFTLVECCLLLYIFSLILVPFVQKKWFWIAGIFFTALVLIDVLWWSNLEQFNTYSTAVESLFLIILPLIFFYKTLQELLIEHLEQEPIFWINVAVLLYFSSSLFIFLFTDFFKASDTALFVLWSIHGIFNILHNIFYSIALWLKPKTWIPG